MLRPWSIVGESREATGLEASSVPAAGTAGTDGALPRPHEQATVPLYRQPQRLAHRRPAAAELRHGTRHRQRALESNEIDMF